MDLFARINAVYGTFFGSSPPSRACVAVDLPEGLRVKLDCIAYAEKEAAERQALHVQGLSYWAPANIGPYSQAIIVCIRTVFGLRDAEDVHNRYKTSVSSFPAKLAYCRTAWSFHLRSPWLWRQHSHVSMSTALLKRLGTILVVGGKDIHSSLYIGCETCQT